MLSAETTKRQLPEIYLSVTTLTALLTLHCFWENQNGLADIFLSFSCFFIGERGGGVFNTLPPGFFSYWQNQICFRNLSMVGAACVGFYLRIYLLYCESASFYLLMKFWVGGAMWVGVPDGKTIIHNQGSGPGPQGWQSGAKWAIMPILHQGWGGGVGCTNLLWISLCHPDHKHHIRIIIILHPGWVW